MTAPWLVLPASRELVDSTISVIDVAGGEEIPRPTDPGMTRSDLLAVTKLDLAPHVGAGLQALARDAACRRGVGPTGSAQRVRGEDVPTRVAHIVAARPAARAAP